MSTTKRTRTPVKDSAFTDEPSESVRIEKSEGQKKEDRQRAGKLLELAAVRIGEARQLLGETRDGERVEEVAQQVHELGQRIASNKREDW